MPDCLTPSLAERVPQLRQQFPSLQRCMPHSGQPVIYLDGPAGSQVPQSVIEAIRDYYQHHNANVGGRFPSSQETSDLMLAAHRAAADWFGAADWRECVFGANMTTLTLAFSRALARTWQAGDVIVVTELDHDGNVTPWKLAAADAGVEVLTVRIDPRDATLDMEELRRHLARRPRLLALTCASNSVGSKPTVPEIIQLAHAVGVEVYLDAVHYAPHALIDVQSWDADYCICSAYKFFGPHVGLLWGRLARLEALTAYKLRPAPAQSPGKWMTGTQNFAAIAGVVAAIDYIAALGGYRASQASEPGARRAALRTAFAAIECYERGLLEQLLQGLARLPKVHVFGITDLTRLHERVPTLTLNIAGWTSSQTAAALAERGIFVWHGDYYAVDVCRALGQAAAGMVRLGIMHINTPEEIERTLQAIAELSQAAAPAAAAT